MPPLSRYRLIIGWLKEFLWTLIYLLHLFPGFLVRLRPKKSKSGQTVVIIPDFGCHPLLYVRLSRFLEKAGFGVHILPPPSAFSSLRVQALKLAQTLEARDIRHGILLGHGMGSLVPLAMPDAGRQRIRHLLPLGSPFHGSRLYIYLQFIPAFRDLAVGSEYLLLNRMNALLFHSFTPFIAWQDQFIVPFNLAHFGQGRDLVLDQVGHFNLILGKENIVTLIDYLRQKYPLKALPAPITPPAEPAPAAPETHAQKTRKKAPARKKAAKKASKKVVKKTTRKKAVKKTAKKLNKTTGRK